MAYSYSFLLHLIAFGFTAAAIIALFILHRKLSSEKDWSRRFYVAGMMRTFAMFGPYTIVVLLLTGIGNMVNRYGLYSPWPHEMWLMIKIALFIIMAFNGAFIGPRISIKRTKLIKSVLDNNGPDNSEELLVKQNTTISIFIYIQATLLFIIVVLSAFGDGKHPGIF